MFISAIICIIPFTRTHLCGHLFLFTLCVIVTCTCKGVHARDCDWPGVPGAARPGQCPSCSHWLTERNILRCPDTRHSSGPGPGQEVRGDACRDPHVSCYPTSWYDMTQLATHTPHDAYLTMSQIPHYNLARCPDNKMHWLEAFKCLNQSLHWNKGYRTWRDRHTHMDTANYS